MNLGAGIVVGVVLLAVVLAVVAFRSREKRPPVTNSTKQAGGRVEVLETYTTSTAPPAAVEPQKAPALSEAERRYAQMKDTLRPLPHEGVAGTMALTQHLSMGDALLSKEDILKASVEVGFSLESVVGAMGASNFSLDEILTFVDDHFTFDLPDLVKALFALPHEDSPLERSTALVATIQGRYDADGYGFDDEDISALAVGALTLGCTKEEVTKILYAEFDFQTVLSVLARKEDVTSEYLAQVAREADVDLTDSELYSSLRENHSLSLVAGALKILGTERDTILDCEAVHLDNEYDEVDGALEDMKDSGFSAAEILMWLIDSQYSTLGAEDVITEAFESTEEETLSEDELVWLSLTLEDEVDISDIERQLIEDEVDFDDRIEFLYKLFVAQRDARAAKEAQSTTEEVVTT